MLIRTDASGDHGFGACAHGFHLAGTWSKQLAPLIKHNMLFKEALPMVIMVILLSPHLPACLFGDSTDNSGLVFRANAGSAKCPFTRRILRAMRTSLDKHGSWCITDWNDRDQDDAVHADKISKVFSIHDWASFTNASTDSWKMQCVLHNMQTDECFQFTFRMPSCH